MILALFALAAVMIIGGIASVIQGFPFVRLESGLAMVIAGATVASAGAVILALGVVAGGLRRVERAVNARALPAAGDADRAPAREFGSASKAAAPLFPARVDPVLPEGAGPAPASGRPVLGTAAGLPGAGLAGAELAGAGLAGAGLAGAGLAGAGLVGTGLAGAGLASGRAGTEPTFTDTLFPERDAPSASTLADDPSEAHRAEIEPELPLPEPAGFVPPPPAPAPSEPEAVPEPDDGIAPEDDLFVAPETAAPPLRPALDTAAEPEPEPEASPEPAEPEAEAEAEPAPKLEVVGTYASGSNTYVMFSNGSIEAETPRGRFTFASLDELKAFVEAGGESDTRGAA
ncbi:hypothetical protein [Methylobacterium planeticum]|uniref:DUF308 domain-containing protein n=1 Tax=Methylobacterium planeticum TaxID=2615211 RepID=A0A6N6MSU7_9HYPH|nr:hypothetical protein [Methylobacterium planeticum]KAB1073400.1 hypothetical protein F6X51_11665 [Methylobacterium planeticum]